MSSRCLRRHCLVPVLPGVHGVDIHWTRGPVCQLGVVMDSSVVSLSAPRLLDECVLRSDSLSVDSGPCSSVAAALRRSTACLSDESAHVGWITATHSSCRR